MTDVQILNRARKKAEQSICKYRVSAVGFDKKGRMIGTACNRPRFSKEGGSIHAEMRLMAQYGVNLHTIIICRISDNGNLKPIDPCSVCAAKAKELGIKIVSIEV
jgi:tRNA(Arg) A34 adenosine deaminase TadA